MTPKGEGEIETQVFSTPLNNHIYDVRSESMQWNLLRRVLKIEQMRRWTEWTHKGKKKK